jgi:hypothetical protein
MVESPIGKEKQNKSELPNVEFVSLGEYPTTIEAISKLGKIDLVEKFSILRDMGRNAKEIVFTIKVNGSVYTCKVLNAFAGYQGEISQLKTSENLVIPFVNGEKLSQGESMPFVKLVRDLDQTSAEHDTNTFFVQTKTNDIADLFSATIEANDLGALNISTTEPIEKRTIKVMIGSGSSCDLTGCKGMGSSVISEIASIVTDIMLGNKDQSITHDHSNVDPRSFAGDGCTVLVKPDIPSSVMQTTPVRIQDWLLRLAKIKTYMNELNRTRDADSQVALRIVYFSIPVVDEIDPRVTHTTTESLEEIHRKQQLTAGDMIQSSTKPINMHSTDQALIQRARNDQIKPALDKNTYLYLMSWVENNFQDRPELLNSFKTNINRFLEPYTANLTQFTSKTQSYDNFKGYYITDPDGLLLIINNMLDNKDAMKIGTNAPSSVSHKILQFLKRKKPSATNN